MSDLFSDEWMKSFMEQWNAEPDLADALAKINFNSVIAYGFDGEDTPRGVITVENGKATSAGIYNGGTNQKRGILLFFVHNDGKNRTNRNILI